MTFDLNDDNAWSCSPVTWPRQREIAAILWPHSFRRPSDAWKDYRRTGEEQVYVGYSPIIVVDADKILNDLPAAHVLHVIRNPYSAYADTKKRAVPLSLEHYLLGWNLNQYHALLFQKRYPERVHIVTPRRYTCRSDRCAGARV